MTLVSHCNKKQEIKEYSQNEAAMLDTLQTYRNKNNEQVAKIKVLKYDNHKQFLNLVNNSQSLQMLQEEMKRLRGKAKEADIIYVETVTTIQGEVDTVYETITAEGDTVLKTDIRQYGDWITGYIFLGKDTSDININVKNEFVGSLYYERDKGIGNWFKPKHPVFELTNKNPYTSTTDMRVVITKNTPTRFNLSGGIGYGVGYDAGRLTTRPFVGLMLGYKLIDF